MAADEIARFGITPKIALVSHSNFGVHEGSACKMRRAVEEIRTRRPDLEIDGEMHGDTALSPSIREMIMPNSTLKGEANLLVMPNIESANISFNVLKVIAEGTSIGPILMGIAKPGYVLTASATARSVVNMTALACVGAQVQTSVKQDKI